jgi:organic radical activating enzyme
MHNSGIKYDPKVELTRMTIDEVVGALTDLTSEKVNPSLIIISGGEPMLQQEGIAKLVRALPFVEFEIETAGTREVEEVLIESFYIAGTYPRLRFNVSPKLEHSGNSIEERRVYPALKSLSRQSSVFKFVVTKGTWEDDVREIRGIQAYLTLPSERIYIMPEGTTRTGQIKSMEYFADRVVEQGWNLTPRLHTLIWGDERGK